MNDDFDNLDSLIQQHLRAELDPARRQIGEGVHEECETALVALGDLGRRIDRRDGRVHRDRVGHVATCRTDSDESFGRQYVQSTKPIETWPVSQVVQHQDVDEGTVVFDELGAARRVRQEFTQTTTFYDPSGNGRLEVTEPREVMTYVALQPH